MRFAVEVLEEDRLVRARWSGTSDVGDARAAVAEIKDQIRSHPVEGVLLDVRDVRSTLTADEASAVGDEFVEFLGRRRLALVSKSPEHDGLARSVARQAEPQGVDIDVFRDEHTAIEWLHSPDVE